MFWLEGKIQTKPSSLVQWARLQPTRLLDAFHPHDQFFMNFFSSPPVLSPPPVQLGRFISSLFPVLLGNNKCKIMTAVRVGAGVVCTQEKGSFVISASVSAIQRQQNTHNTYTALRTMSPRHQSREWKGESKGGRGRGSEKQLRKTDWKKTKKTKITCYRGNVWRHYSRLFISARSSWPLPAHLSVHSQQMNLWRCYLYSQNKSCQKQDLFVQQHINI